MTPEIHISSAIAVIILLLFTFVTHRYRKSLFTEEHVDMFMLMYATVFMVFTGLFVYLIFRTWFQQTLGVSVVPAVIISSVLTVLLSTWQFGKGEHILIYLLAGKIIDGKSPWVAPLIILVQETLFLGIITFQLNWVYGICILVAIIGGVIVLDFLINTLLKGLNSAIEWVTCEFNTEG